MLRRSAKFMEACREREFVRGGAEPFWFEEVRVGGRGPDEVVDEEVEEG